MPRIATRKAPSTYHHGDLREALIEAALVEVERNGHEAVNFTGLARTLGVSQAAPYRHFVDRDELLTAVGALGFQAFSAAGQEAVESARGSPLGISPLGMLARAYLEFGLSRPGLYRLMYGSGILPKGEEGSPLKLAASECFHRVLAALPAELDDIARERIAIKAWAAVHGIVTMVEQGLLPKAEEAFTLEDLVDEQIRDIELSMAAAIAARRRA